MPRAPLALLALLALAACDTADTAASDTLAPSLTITAPQASAPVSGTVTVACEAEDRAPEGAEPSGLFPSYTLLVDGAEASVSPAGCSFLWPTVQLTNGPHQLEVEGRDMAGNVGRSPAVTVTVSN